MTLHHRLRIAQPLWQNECGFDGKQNDGFDGLSYSLIW